MRHIRTAMSTAMLAATLISAHAHAQQAVTARTPATPLVAHDPYFSIWSFDDELTARATRHWTGKEQQLSGWIRVDGKAL